MGRAPCCEKIGMKKGRWTAEEDEILLSYIRVNGEGSWRHLPKNAGLLRCGKSCRLRWINYLRSGLKKGNMTTEEDNIIIEMHASLGNRWSLIASHLSGRTDNEIKNYWNSHLSRKIDSFRPRPRATTCTQGTASTIIDISKVNTPGKTQGGKTSSGAMKKNKYPTSEKNIRPSGVGKNNASSDEAAILLPQPSEVENESLPSLMMKNNMIFHSGDHGQDIDELKETPRSTNEVGPMRGIGTRDGLEDKCDDPINGNEIKSCNAPEPSSEENINIDEDGTLCFDDILGYNIQDLGDVLDETQDAVMCVGDQSGVTYLNETDLENANHSSNKEVSAASWFPSSPMSLAFGDDGIENGNWNSDEQPWYEQKFMLWEVEKGESDCRESQSLDPERESAMVAWLLS